MSERLVSSRTLNGVREGRTGQVLLASAAMSSVTTVTLDNVFSPQYQAFQILIRNEGSSGTVTMQLRTGGVSATSNYNRQETVSSSTTLAAARTTGQPSILIGAFGSTASHANIHLFSPNLATSTVVEVRSSHGASFDIAQPLLYDILTFHTTATAYDGFILTATNANSLIGRYWVYGLAGVS
jgi:hypothetical protein